MKTPIKELIEIIKNRQEDDDAMPFMWNGDIIKLAESLLKKEKGVIIDARNDGFMASGEGWNGEYGIEDFSSLTKEIKSEQYYNETYEGNK
jgi:hypothetical protein